MHRDNIVDMASAELLVWRTRTLNALLVIVVIAATPVIAFVLHEAVHNPEQWPAALLYLAMYFFIGALATLRHLDVHLRAWGLLLLGYAAGVLAFARGGLAGDGRIYLLALPVLALILIGVRSGLAMAALSLLTFAAFTVTAHQGWMASWLVRQDNTLLLMDWVIGGIAFALALVVLVATQWYFSRFQEAIIAAKARLYDEANRLRAFNENIVQSMEEGVLLEDATGHIIFANPKIARLLDYTPEDLAGRHWTAIVDPEYRAEVKERAAGLPQSAANRYETVLLNRHGQRVPVIISSRALFDNGRSVGVLSVVTDITERKRAEEALLETESMARALLNATMDAAFLMDTQGIVLASNETTARRLGKSVDALLGCCVYDLLPPDVAQVRRAMAEESVRSGTPVRLEDERQGMYLDNSIYPVFNAQGRGTRLAVYSRDVTAHKRAEQQAMRAERLAAMGYMAAALAHEINNPLQAMRSNLELALDFDLESGEHRAYLDVIRQEIDRLAGLARRMLELGRPVTDTWYPVSMAHLVQRTLTLVDKQLQLDHVEVATDIPTDLPSVFVAPDRIVQVLLNLILNAVAAMPDGGHVWITGRTTERNMVALTLTDDGPPLPADHLEHIFDPFFTSRPDGTGLGLSISHDIVQQYGGTMRVENLADGHGVAFTVMLPVARPKVSQETVS
jgi:two-component system sporulation sensor kinase A